VGSKLAVPVQPLEVTVLRESRSPNRYSLRDMASNASPVRLSGDELVARIREAQARRPDQPVVIAADGRAEYQEVIGLLDLLQRNGVQRVGLLARQPS
jgi:biopolymer transport protein TolR